MSNDECGCTDFQACPTHERALETNTALAAAYGAPVVIGGAKLTDLPCHRCGAPLVDYGIDVCCSDAVCAQTTIKEIFRMVHDAFARRRKARSAAAAEQIMQWVIDVVNGHRSLTQTRKATEALITEYDREILQEATAARTELRAEWYVAVEERLDTIIKLLS
jgi:uncharacterized Zn finger protein (UPF0148 family)